MRTKLTKITLAAALALAFILSCSSDIELPPPPEINPSSSSAKQSEDCSALQGTEVPSCGISSSSYGGQIDGNIFTDSRDGNKYKIEVAPNGTIWMSENLNYSKGGTIGYCYGESLSMPGVDVPTCNSYGRTYSYLDAMVGNSPQGVCPSGWHIPSVAEWQSIGAGNGSTATGTRIMSSGFYILAGNYDPAKGWKERGTNGFYWTNNGSSSFVNIYNSDGSFAFNTQTVNVSNDYFSVRCVKDASSYVSGTFTDSRDLQTYKWVKIGAQVWMAKNLNYNAAGSVCYNDNSTNCATYGRLYDWATAMGIDAKYNEELWNGSDIKHKGICPSGWHLPSNAEWETLRNYVESSNGCTQCAGKHLKATSGWNSYSGIINLDTYGFSALPGGYGFPAILGCGVILTSGYHNIGNLGDWLSSSESYDYYNYARSWNMFYYGDYAFIFDAYYIGGGGCYIDNGFKSLLSSVRCVED
jgi:uncharacterized protein (TIGR02145 family)